jgi:L-ascorbate metabolism protein UlaG (beta-lactamase superfamily)
VDADENCSIGGITFHGVAAAHNTVERDENGHCRFLGYVVRTGNLCVYHSGDTLLHDQLAATLKTFSIDLALLPINGNRPERRVAGNLDGREAARLAFEIGAGMVIPHHFDMFEFNTETPDLFEQECLRLAQKFMTLGQGEGLICRG